MEQPIKRFAHLVKIINSKYFSDLGNIEFIMDEKNQIEIIKIIPHKGIHKDIQFILTIKFQEHDKWPFVYIDYEIYDKIKTSDT